eukprot:3188455-Amphidinium_carterae.1
MLAQLMPVRCVVIRSSLRPILGRQNFENALPCHGVTLQHAILNQCFTLPWCCASIRKNRLGFEERGTHSKLRTKGSNRWCRAAIEAFMQMLQSTVAEGGVDEQDPVA